MAGENFKMEGGGQKFTNVISHGRRTETEKQGRRQKREGNSMKDRNKKTLNDSGRKSRRKETDVISCGKRI